MFGKCGCGRDGRYFNATSIQDENEWSCNKYMRCPTYAELEETAKKRAEVIYFGLQLIAVSEMFSIDLGKGWRDFKQKAKEIGLEIVNHQDAQGSKDEGPSESPQP